MNLETKEKTHVKGTGVMCPMDGYVVFRRSELLCGRLGKVTLGGSNKSGLFQVCHLPGPPSPSCTQNTKLAFTFFCTILAEPHARTKYSRLQSAVSLVVHQHLPVQPWTTISPQRRSSSS